MTVIAETNSINYSGRETYYFVDGMRFIAIFLITFGHSNLLGENLNTQGLSINSLLYSLTKFDIICMYLVSGFLMGSVVGKSTSYIYRRIKRTGGPWLLWATLSVLVLYVGTLIGGSSRTLLEIIRLTIFYSSYWFIPNYIFSLFVMFGILKFIPMKLAGALLAISSLCYGLNLYFEWFTTNHTVAWGGFMFYLWLGTLVRQHWASVSAWIRQLSFSLVLTLVIGTGVLVALETWLLISLGSQDPANALKFSNHLYSLAWALLLIKIPGSIVPNGIDSRRESFGVYLVHPIVIMGLLFIYRRLHMSLSDQHDVIQLISWLFNGVLVYTLSILVVKGLTRIGWGRLVGDLK